MRVSILFSDAVERSVVVEAKVTGMDDILGIGLSREVVQLAQVSADICYTQDAHIADLLDATLVRLEWTGARHGCGLRCAVGEVSLGVCARLRRRLRLLEEKRQSQCQGLT